MIEFVWEGNSGILERCTLTGKKTHIPDCDTNRAGELLTEFFFLEDKNSGACLKDVYWRKGYNWFPGVIEDVYWRGLLRYVKYKSVLRQYIEKSIRPVFLRRVDLGLLMKTLSKTRAKPGKAADILARKVVDHNREVSEKNHRPDILFYCGTPENFRTRELLENFEADGVQAVYVLWPAKKRVEQVSSYSRPGYFFHRGGAAGNIFDTDYDVSTGCCPNQISFEPFF